MIGTLRNCNICNEKYEYGDMILDSLEPYFCWTCIHKYASGGIRRIVEKIENENGYIRNITNNEDVKVYHTIKKELEDIGGYRIVFDDAIESKYRIFKAPKA